MHSMVRIMCVALIFIRFGGCINSIHIFRWTNVFPLILIVFIYEFNWMWLLCCGCGKPKKPLMSNVILEYKICVCAAYARVRFNILEYMLRWCDNQRPPQRLRLTLFTFTVLFIMRSLVWMPQITWTRLHAILHMFHKLRPNYCLQISFKYLNHNVMICAAFLALKYATL